MDNQNSQDVQAIIAGLSEEEKAALIERALKAKAKGVMTRRSLEYYQEKHADKPFQILALASEDNHGSLYACRCDCGKEFTRYGSDLHTGRGCPTCTAKFQAGASKRRRLELKAAALLIKQRAEAVAEDGDDDES